jgi:signal transduction histidine kinase
MLADATDRARRLMFELRPPLLEETGLAAAITDLCDQLADDGGFRASVEAPPRRYPRVIEDICYRTVREAALNTRRHAQAANLRVRIDEREGVLMGLVEDDGIGFDPAAPIDRRDANLHLGIYAMSQRVTLADGSVEIDSRPGAGTRVFFRIPAA